MAKELAAARSSVRLCALVVGNRDLDGLWASRSVDLELRLGAGRKLRGELARVLRDGFLPGCSRFEPGSYIEVRRGRLPARRIPLECIRALRGMGVGVWDPEPAPRLKAPRLRRRANSGAPGLPRRRRGREPFAEELARPGARALGVAWTAVIICAAIELAMAICLWSALR